MTFMFVNEISERYPDDSREFGVLLDYNYEDENEELPQF
jgi:hypothetical protein